MKVERSHQAPARHQRAGWSPLAAALLLAGCGNLTAGGVGEATVFVTGDAPGALAAAAPASTLGPRSPAASGDDEPEGELEMEFLLHLVTDEGEAVPLTDQAARLRVEFPGPQEVEVVTRAVPARRYAALRVTFTELEAEVEAGLVIDGVPVTGSVEVELEGPALVVERALDLDLGDGGRAELLVDMNASGWLTAVDPDLKVVAGAVVSNLIRVVRRR